MKHKKLTVLCFSSLLLFSSIVPTNLTSNTIANAATTSTKSSNSTTVDGQVTKISGKKITLALGTLMMHAPKDDNKVKPSGIPKEKPSGTPKDSLQAKPNGAPKDFNPFTKNGKTKSITLTSKSVIKLKTKSGTSKGSLSNIKVGSLLSITYTQNGTLSTITVLNAQK